MGCCGSEPKKQNNNNNNQDNDDDDIVEKDGLGDTKNLILWGVLIIIIAGFLIWLN